MQKKIILYDGDGGGLGAHIRHFAHIYYLSLHLNLEIYCFIPTINFLFDHPFRCSSPPASFNEFNADLIDRITEANDEPIKIKNLRAKTLSNNAKYFISGKHHGPEFWSRLEQLKTIKRINLLKLLLSSVRPKKKFEDLGNEKLTRAGLEDKSKFISIHLRTFYDSEEGRRKYLLSKENQFECFLFNINEVIMRREYKGIKQVFIASDSITEGQELATFIEQHSILKCFVDRDKIVHSTTANVFGIDVLTAGNNIRDQLRMCNKCMNTNEDLFAHSVETLALLLALCRAEIIISSTSSIGPLAAAMGDIEAIIIPNFHGDFANHLTRTGPYC